MPRVEFTEQNVKKNDYDYPKFKLVKKGELARVALLEAPVAEFVHDLRKPKLVGGQPQMVTKTRKDDTTYEDYSYEFVSRPICLGDYGTLQEDGSDPEHCPICAEAKMSDMFYAPKRRFALHVVKYETKPNSTDVKEPFGASTQVYSFTDTVFSELFSFKQQGFDLRKHDIIVKCENPTFNGYGFMPAMEAEWLKDDARKKYVSELMKPENLAPDLSIFCGSRKSEKSIEYDIRAVKETWAIVTGVSTSSPVDAALSTVGSASAASAFEGLLGETDAEGWAKPSAASSFDDLGIGDDSLAASVGATDDEDDEISRLLGDIESL